MIPLSFDENKTACINPEDVVSKKEDCPKVIVTCFAHNLMEHAVEKYQAQVYDYIYNTNGPQPIYKLNMAGQCVGLFMSAV